MEIIGVIAEYNPFHNGHKYHLEKIKELFPNSIIIVILTGHFMQRGDVAIINKWARANTALQYGADLVIELPFPFASQSADIFAKGAIQLLKHLGATHLVFGSESNDVDKLIKLADTQLENKDYELILKNNLKQGLNYPTALSKALKDVANIETLTPNDLLGIAYIKAIKQENTNIIPITIKRTNDYHSEDLNNLISSATAIRKNYNDPNLASYVPKETFESLQGNLAFRETLWPYLKYQIINNDLSNIQTVDEGIENRLKKLIKDANTWDELVNLVKTKRYTYNKINRMFIHIITNFTKDIAKEFQNIGYIRILGFNDLGQSYLNKIKKELSIPLITKITNNPSKMLEFELKTTQIYDLINNTNYLNQEYQTIIKPSNN